MLFQARAGEDIAAEAKKRRITAVYSPPQVDRTCGILGSYYNIPKAIFYRIKGDYTCIQELSQACHMHSYDIPCMDALTLLFL